MEVHGVKTENETQNHQSKKLIIKKLKEGKICSRKQEGFIVKHNRDPYSVPIQLSPNFFLPNLPTHRDQS